MNIAIRYLIAIFLCYASLYAGFLFVGPESAAWYARVSLDALLFPLSIFIPAVLIVHGVTGFAVGLLWSRLGFWHQWVGCFFISLMFVSAWIMFLFGYFSVILALIVAVLLIVMVIPLFMGAWEIERRAAYLFIPYALWIVYILYLTAAVWLGMDR